MDITQIVLAIITLCTVVLTVVVIPKIKTKHPQEEINKALDKLEVYKNVAMLACRMIDYLKKAGIEINEDQITAAIESAVLEINKTLRNPAPNENEQKDCNPEWSGKEG